MWASLKSLWRRQEDGARMLSDGQRAAGRSQILAPVPSSGKDGAAILGTTILNVSAKDPTDPGVITVDFDVQPLGPSPVGASNGPYPLGYGGGLGATLNWGTGQARHTAYIDLVHGTKISLSCSTLRVDAFNRGAPVDPSFQVSASASYGSRSGSHPVTVTARQVVLDGGFSSLIPIPKYAKTFTVYADTLAVAVNAEVRATEFLADAPLYRSGAMESPVDLGGGAYDWGSTIAPLPSFLRIGNPNVTVATFVIYTVIFKLTL